MAHNTNHKILGKYINKKYLSAGTILNLKSTFIRNKPYPYLELNDFFIKERAQELLLALSKERFYEKNSDLFKFYQTNDIISSKNIRLLQFRNFLASKELIFYMESLTGFQLKPWKVDLAGTLYKDTNFLLCHDDRLENRRIAFLIYLSDIEKNDGGSLNLMNKDFNAVKKIIPKFNKFAFFEVSNKSFHEVEELVKDKQRIAFGGWFHDK